MSSGLPSAEIICSSTTTLLTFSSVGSSYIVSSRTCSRIERRPRAGLLRASALGDRPTSRRARFALDAFYQEQRLVLFDVSAFWLGVDLGMRVFVSIF